MEDPARGMACGVRLAPDRPADFTEFLSRFNVSAQEADEPFSTRFVSATDVPVVGRGKLTPETNIASFSFPRRIVCDDATTVYRVTSRLHKPDNVSGCIAFYELQNVERADATFPLRLAMKCSRDDLAEQEFNFAELAAFTKVFIVHPYEIVDVPQSNPSCYTLMPAYDKSGADCARKMTATETFRMLHECAVATKTLWDAGYVYLDFKPSNVLCWRCEGSLKPRFALGDIGSVVGREGGGHAFTFVRPEDLDKSGEYRPSSSQEHIAWTFAMSILDMAAVDVMPYYHEVFHERFLELYQKHPVANVEQTTGVDRRQQLLAVAFREKALRQTMRMEAEDAIAKLAEQHINAEVALEIMRLSKDAPAKPPSPGKPAGTTAPIDILDKVVELLADARDRTAGAMTRPSDTLACKIREADDGNTWLVDCFDGVNRYPIYEARDRDDILARLGRMGFVLGPPKNSALYR